MSRTRRRQPTKPPVTLDPLTEAAYAICYAVHSGGCVCRDRGRGESCNTMMSAARAASTIFIKREVKP